MPEALAAFSPDQLQLIGGLVVTFGSSFVLLVWRVAVWKTRLEDDVNNLGYIVGTEKGKALFEKKKAKKTWFSKHK